MLMADRRRSWLLAVILLIHPGIAAAQGGAPADQQASPGCGLSRTMPPFPAGAEQVAREIGILPLVRRVRDLAATCAPMSQEEMCRRPNRHRNPLSDGNAVCRPRIRKFDCVDSSHEPHSSQPAVTFLYPNESSLHRKATEGRE